MSKPVIGVIPLVDTEKDSYWMLPGYMDGILREGGIPVMLPMTSEREVLEQIADTYDGFLFTGGHDVSPALYGEAAGPFCGECSEARDEMERMLFQIVFEMDKPVFGICRGIQLINVLLGGTLYQDLPTQRPSEIEHHQNPPYDESIHEVEIAAQTPLHVLLGRNAIPVNSYHHQAIKALSPRLKAMALSPDGLVEAAYVPDKKYVWAVQWHPEFSFLKDQNSQKLFKSFLDSMK